MAPERWRMVAVVLLLSLSCCWCGAASAARPALVSSAAAPAPASASSPSLLRFIKAWCAGTEYPALCEATLAPYAAVVRSSPTRLSWAALNVTLGGARLATAAMKAMAASGHLAPLGTEAAQDCVSMLGDAEDLLKQAVETMAELVGKGKKKARGGQAAAAAGNTSSSRYVRFQVSSVQTWASAALTNDDVCVDGFKEEAAGGGGVREAVHGHVVGVSHLTANALGIVNAMANQIPP